jgi:predicted membrane-bound spermidine synthase
LGLNRGEFRVTLGMDETMELKLHADGGDAVTPESPTVPLYAAHAKTGASPRNHHSWLLLLFLVSGAAALIYQICWQRLLFESIGVDIESVTIIVSTFMLGLGLGSLVGGELADRHPGHALELFALVELATGVFGAFSPTLIRAVSAATVHGSLVTITAANFGLLLVPTILMGATLPILVSHVVRTYRNLGVSVGVLYFANTLGAALGAGLTGFVVLYYFGLTGTIYAAAALNVVISATVWFALRGARV